MRELQRLENHPPQAGDEEPEEGPPPARSAAAAAQEKKKVKVKRMQKASLALVSSCSSCFLTVT